MLAFLHNLSWAEIAWILVLAVLIFGKRLPQVAGETMRGFARLRRQLEDLRRESGIDREILEVRSSLRELEREVRVEPARAPADRREPPRARPTTEPRLPTAGAPPETFGTEDAGSESPPSPPNRSGPSTGTVAPPSGDDPPSPT